MMECVSRHLVSGVFASAMLVSVAYAAVLEEPEGYPLECYENGETIFTSEIADIAEFDAASYNVTLQQTVPVTEKNAVIYYFGPAKIVCVVVSD